jgi:hypothetical protein
MHFLNPGLMSTDEYLIDSSTASLNSGKTLFASFLPNILRFNYKVLELVVLVQFMLICDVVITVKHFLELSHIILRR